MGGPLARWKREEKASDERLLNKACCHGGGDEGHCERTLKKAKEVLDHGPSMEGAMRALKEA